MNPQDLLNKLLSNPAAGAAAGGFVGSGLTGLLASKKGRKTAKNLATYGGIATLGVIAYKAYSNSQKQNFAQADLGQAESFAKVQNAAQNTPFLPSAQQPEQVASLSRHLIEAMISAAKADGAIDAAEQQKIQTQLASTPLSADEKAYLFDCMNQQADPARIAALATSPQEASELYLASLLAIDVDHWAEQAYLQALQQALNINDELAQQLQQELD